jgi:hypothetical protein
LENCLEFKIYNLKFKINRVYSKILTHIFLIVLTIILQIAFISGLPFWLKNLNFIIVVLVMILGFSGLKTALWWTVSLGFLIEIYSFMPFGINLIALLATILAVNFLLINFFTDRSLYALLALTFFASVVFKICIIIFDFIYNYLTKADITIYFNGSFFFNFISGLFLNFLAVIFIFYFLSYLSNRFRPVFLKAK